MSNDSIKYEIYSSRVESVTTAAIAVTVIVATGGTATPFLGAFAGWLWGEQSKKRALLKAQLK